MEKTAWQHRAFDLLHTGSEATPPSQHERGELCNMPLAGRAAEWKKKPCSDVANYATSLSLDKAVGWKKKTWCA
jgi:hypothetical protein